MNFRRNRRRSNTDINLTPLIDVVFLLLIFFMVSTTFTRETHLAIELPEAAGPVGELPVEAIEIVVGRDGRYALNGAVFTDSQQLGSSLLSQSDGRRDMPIAITADAQASHQAVVQVMDMVGQLGFAQLRISTRQPGEG